MRAVPPPAPAVPPVSRRSAWVAALPALCLLAALAGLPGCASTPGSTSTSRAAGAAPAASPAGTAAAGGSSGGPATALARAQNALVTERQWLQTWFSGTPVQIVQQGDGPVNVSVPQEFCFDTGSSRVLPALAAVLDKVALSLRRTPQAQLQTLAASGDNGAASPLALQRARQVRARLRSRGVAAAQLAPATATAQPGVQLQMALPSH